MVLDIRRSFSLTFIFFWTLYFVQIPQYESLTSWPVNICPGNQSEVEAATLRLNCSDVRESINVYHCLPLSNLSQLVEFCYDGLSGLIEAGNCMVLYRETLNNYPCGHFTNGCPNKYYFPKHMYNYPACLNINPKNSCYIADPNCPNVRFLETKSVTAMVNKTQTVDATTAINNKSHRDESTLNGNDNDLLEYFIPISLGLLFPLITIAFVIFWRYKQNRKDKVKELESLNREPPSLKTELKTNNPEHSMILVCEVIGSQRSAELTDIFWTKDNVKIDIRRNGGKYVVGTIADHSLQINEVNETDVGVYQCSANYASGTVYSEITHLELPVLRLQRASSGENEVIISYSVVQEGYPKVHSIKWTKDRNPLDRNTAKYSGGSLETTFLKIHSPSENDIGEYGCEISSVLGSATDSLILKSPIIRLQGASSGENEVIISYSVVQEGYPKVHSIKWTKDGNPLDRKTAKYSGGRLETTFLKIHSPSENDIGEYGCEISSVLGSATDSISLKLPVLRLQGASSGENEIIISYSVVQEGYPKVHSIEWTKDRNPLERNTIKYSGGGLKTTSLKIHSPSEDDVGEYSCEISSILGSVQESLRLKLPVLRLQGASSGKDEVTISYSVVQEGYPKVHSIKWTKNGNPLERNTHRYSGGDLETIYLRIYSPTEDDLGEYGCEIFSILGSVKESLSLIAPVVTIPEQLAVTIGSPATIEAKVKSCPSLEKVVWQKSMESNPESFQDVNIFDSKYIGSKGDPSDPKLVISSSTYDDGQYYRLLVFNGIAQSTSNMALLKVESEYNYLGNEDFRGRFKKYLEEGSVEVCPISQIIIVGEQGVGKTTLLYRLQGKSREAIDSIRSTQGVECHTEHHSFIITKNQLVAVGSKSAGVNM